MENALCCPVPAVRARPSHPDDPRPASDQRKNLTGFGERCRNFWLSGRWRETIVFADFVLVAVQG